MCFEVTVVELVKESASSGETEPGRPEEVCCWCRPKRTHQVAEENRNFLSHSLGGQQPSVAASAEP